jgi:hypothetical protein
VEATINDPETAPLLIEQVSDATTDPPDNVHPLSLDEKPDPDTWTVAPIPAFAGFMVIVGVAEFTRKLAEAESPPGLAIAVMV